MGSPRLARPASLLVIVGLALAIPARAIAQQGDVAAAADAYSRAQQAELRGDLAEAAQLYALADDIAPTAEALRSAARVAMRAGLHATAATHASALLSRESADPESRALAEEIIAATEAGLARIEARYSQRCRILVDGRVAAGAWAESHVLYARPGERRVSASFDGAPASDERSTTLRAGARVAIRLAPAVAASERSAPSASEPGVERGGGGGLSPWFFAAASVLTVASGATLIWSGADVLAAHSRYDPSAPGADAAYRAGLDLEMRTNVLIGVTAGLALTTLIVGIFTDWSGGSAEGERVAGAPLALVSSEGLALGWSGRFE